MTWTLVIIIFMAEGTYGQVTSEVLGQYYPKEACEKAAKIFEDRIDQSHRLRSITVCVPDE